MVVDYELDGMRNDELRDKLSEFPHDATVIFDRRLFTYQPDSYYKYAYGLKYDDWTNEIIIYRAINLNTLKRESVS